MRVHFYGTRGSIPTSRTGAEQRTVIAQIIKQAIRKKVKAKDVDKFLAELKAPSTRFRGGNTSCIGVYTDEDVYAIDCGSGARVMGLDLLKGRYSFADRPLYVLLSHVHWDHICGFPFLVPVFIPGNQVTVASGHPDAAKAIKGQMQAPCFPVPFGSLPSSIRFRKLPESRATTLGDSKVKVLPMHHPNKSYGYRVEHEDGVVVYLSDTEILGKKKGVLKSYRDFARGADLVVVDSQYTFREGYQKMSWGHSSIYSFIDVCMETGIRRMAMFHHDPTYSDEKIDEIELAAREYVRVNSKEGDFEVFAAGDGMELEIKNGKSKFLQQ